MRIALATVLLFFACGAHANILRGGASGTTPPATCTSGTAGQIAACLTAQFNQLCTTIGDFWAEIGTASSGTTPLWTYQSGNSISRPTVIQIDSASKMIFEATYITQANGIGNLSADEVAHLQQTSGYVNGPSSCAATGTVISCLTQFPSSVACVNETGYSLVRGGTTYTVPNNGYGADCPQITGLFHYNGENFQTVAAFDGPSGIWSAGVNNLATYVNSELGLPAGTITYSMPLLAGGANASGAGLALFLQHVLNTSILSSALGTYTVSTNFPNNPAIRRNNYIPTEIAGDYRGQTLYGTTFGSPTAPVAVTGDLTSTGTTLNAIGNSAPNGPFIKYGASQSNATGQGSSPIPENWQYSPFAWIESDPAAHGDGAFSSAGSAGVYPWIDASKTYYGLIMRVNKVNGNVQGGVGYQTAQCGRVIRRAFITGIQQTGTIPTN